MLTLSEATKSWLPCPGGTPQPGFPFPDPFSACSSWSSKARGDLHPAGEFTCPCFFTAVSTCLLLDFFSRSAPTSPPLSSVPHPRSAPPQRGAGLQLPPPSPSQQAAKSPSWCFRPRRELPSLRQAPSTGKLSAAAAQHLSHFTQAELSKTLSPSGRPGPGRVWKRAGRQRGGACAFLPPGRGGPVPRGRWVSVNGRSAPGVGWPQAGTAVAVAR